MDSNSYKTKYLNKESIQKDWYIIDADGKTLGRFSSEVAKILRGKNKPSFTPHMDCGDYVIIINSDGIKLTGKKWRDKQYVSYSGYPGGQKITNPLQLKERKSSTFIIEKAGKGIPKNHRKRIFERFYRIDKSRSKEKGGTGLGLAIVKHIIEGHKTKIKLKSKINTGSIFSFNLKLAPKSSKRRKSLKKVLKKNEVEMI